MFEVFSGDWTSKLTVANLSWSPSTESSRRSRSRTEMGTFFFWIYFWAYLYLALWWYFVFFLAKRRGCWVPQSSGEAGRKTAWRHRQYPKYERVYPLLASFYYVHSSFISVNSPLTVWFYCYQFFKEFIMLKRVPLYRRVKEIYVNCDAGLCWQIMIQLMLFFAIDVSVAMEQ